MDGTYIRCVELIKGVRHLDQFNFNHVQNLCGFRRSVAGYLVKLLCSLDCVKLTGRKKVNGKGAILNHYVVDAFAITKLKQVKFKLDQPAKPKKVSEIKKCEGELQFESGIKVVEKANIGDMGNHSLKQLDRLLAGVRK
ncbi:hypothetical protein [Providencia rustigianii]|uniref:Uncharacterized protein n=1 Tax=Providencia rustigianii DSM 4541 TaxID=500637 RepID=D1NX81_9GAMM|nr:hypothetical protein [Providencia rustigianii]EFB74020.1 hypothetical protein PROVRUST_04509 [Providencia rustigianii DSM 4541]SUC26294.1 Uncharacterised protein [Providencia rustigianii]